MQRESVLLIRIFVHRTRDTKSLYVNFYASFVIISVKLNLNYLNSTPRLTESKSRITI